MTFPPEIKSPTSIEIEFDGQSGIEMREAMALPIRLLEDRLLGSPKPVLYGSGLKGITLVLHWPGNRLSQDWLVKDVFMFVGIFMEGMRNGKMTANSASEWDLNGAIDPGHIHLIGVA
ncbi:hypothetical protein B0H21DRAFT_826779 [Amylocystis lapponica]|nr:hypothetical protein B0H21DRAFT_826779 [Amylocystis lapponica]